MPQSIFLGPVYYGEQQDNAREIEEKLNANFAELYAAYPAAASTYPLQLFRLSVSSTDGTVDSPTVTQTKLNRMLSALRTAGAPLPTSPVQLDPVSPTGFSWNTGPVVNSALRQTAAPTVPSWQIMGGYNDQGYAPRGSGASSLQHFSRKRLITNVALTQLGVLEDGFYVGGSSGGQDTALANAIPISHQIVSGGAVLTQSGSPVTVPAGAGAYPCLAYVAAIPAGTTLLVDKQAKVASTGMHVGAETLVYSSQGASSAVGFKATDGTGSDIGNPTPSGMTLGTGTLLSPAVVGYGVHLYPTFGLVGDSILSRNGETSDGDGGPVGLEGRTVTGGAWGRRAMYLAGVAASREIGYKHLARPSAAMTGLRAGGAQRRAYYPYFSHLVIQMGTNDIGTGRNVDQLRADVEAEIAAYRAIWAAANPGLPCYAIVCTLLPRVSSTGSTSRTALSPLIEAYNALVRGGGIAGSNGYLDPNAAVRSAGDETLWASSADEADGLHPSSAGHAKIAAATAPYFARATSPWISFQV